MRTATAAMPRLASPGAGSRSGPGRVSWRTLPGRRCGRDSRPRRPALDCSHRRVRRGLDQSRASGRPLSLDGRIRRLRRGRPELRVLNRIAGGLARIVLDCCVFRIDGTTLDCSRVAYDCVRLFRCDYSDTSRAPLPLSSRRSSCIFRGQQRALARGFSVAMRESWPGSSHFSLLHSLEVF